MNKKQQEQLYNDTPKMGDIPRLQAIISQLRSHGFNEAANTMVEMAKELSELRRIVGTRTPTA